MYEYEFEFDKCGIIYNSTADLAYDYRITA